MIVGTVTPTAAEAPLHVMALATRRADWASTRQAAIAGNIANADTPGYRARDIEAFDAALRAAGVPLAVTRPGHMSLSALEAQAAEVDRADRTWDVTHSANTVSLDEELAKADATAREHQTALSVVGTFHRMLLTSVSFR